MSAKMDRQKKASVRQILMAFVASSLQGRKEHFFK